MTYIFLLNVMMFLNDDLDYIETQNRNYVPFTAHNRYISGMMHPCTQKRISVSFHIQGSN